MAVLDLWIVRLMSSRENLAQLLKLLVMLLVYCYSTISSRSDYFFYFN